MNKPDSDNELIKYLTKRENLRYTLDILSNGEEIRRHIFWTFWREVQNKLQGSIPKTMRSEKLAWKLWPGEGKMHTESAGIYLWPSRFSGQNQGINYSVATDTNQSLFFGLSWEKPPKPSVLKLQSVEKLIAFTTENEFRLTKWWLGWKYIIRNQEVDGLLISYAKNRESIYREIQESFWPFVEQTFDMVVKAIGAATSTFASASKRTDP